MAGGAVLPGDERRAGHGSLRGTIVAGVASPCDADAARELVLGPQALATTEGGREGTAPDAPRGSQGGGQAGGAAYAPRGTGGTRRRRRSRRSSVVGVDGESGIAFVRAVGAQPEGTLARGTRGRKARKCRSAPRCRAGASRYDAGATRPKPPIRFHRDPATQGYGK